MSEALQVGDMLSTTMFNEKNNEFIKKMYNVILLCFHCEVLHKVVENDMIIKLMIEFGKYVYDEVFYKLLIFEIIIIHSR